MSDFKFSCGHCGQHITADDAWAGHQIKCPNCQGDIVIPKIATPAAPPPLMAAPPTPPPMLSIGAQRPAPSSVSRPGATAYQPAAAGTKPPVKFWVLALASPILVLMVLPLTLIGIAVTKSWLGGLVSMVACIPALICARAALDERKSRRGVRESQLSGVGAIAAWVGMVLGYVWVGLTLIGFCRYSYYKITGTTPPQPQWSYSSSRNSSVRQPRQPTPRNFPMQPAPTMAQPGRSVRPAEPPVTTDPQTVAIADGAPSGTVLGGDFKCTSIKYDANQSLLELNQGSAANPQASIKLWLWLNSQPLAGQTIIVAPNADLGARQPHVHLKGNTGRSDAVVQGYALRLEFDAPSSGSLTGRIYLELPQSYGTRVSGTFKVAAR